MSESLRTLLATRFIAHGYATRWQSDLLWLHAISDTLIALAYLSIPALLIYFIRRRKDIPFQWILWSFCIFMAACGLTHAMDVVTLWTPFYRLAGILKAATALASIGTSIALMRVMPELLRVPSPAQLEATNRELASEVSLRSAAEAALQRAYRQMEAKVEIRTVELAIASVAKQQSDARFRATFEQAAIGLAHLSTTHGEFKEVNSRFCEIVGYSREEILGMTFFDITHPDEIEANRAQGRDLLAGVVRHHCREKRFIHQDGRAIWIEMTGSVVSTASSSEYFVLAVQDITRRKLAEARVLESERKYKELANAMPHIVWTAQPDGKSDYVNDRWYELTGADREPGTLDWERFLHTEDAEQSVAAWRLAVEAATPYEGQFRLWAPRKGEFRWYLACARPVYSDGAVSRWIGTCTDVHDRKTAHDLLEAEVRNRTMDLQKSLLEKETLLKEIHHRVKNNLQVISSLLRMQSEALKDPGAAMALKESQQRVLSMSMIHERLYGNNQFDAIDLGDYTQTLVDELFHSCANPPQRVTSRVDASRVLLNIDQAIPCGLILNELVTNALKYAYPDGAGGEVCIELKESAADRIRLTVSDHGVGLPEGLDCKNLTSLGLPIVDILTKQLGGTLQIESGPGATFHIEFPKKERKAARSASAA